MRATSTSRAHREERRLPHTRRLLVVALTALVVVGMLALPGTAFTDGRFTWTTSMIRVDNGGSACFANLDLHNRSDESVTWTWRTHRRDGSSEDFFGNTIEPGQHGNFRVSGFDCGFRAFDLVTDSDALAVNMELPHRVTTRNADGDEVTTIRSGPVPLQLIGPNGVGPHGETVRQADRLAGQVDGVADELGADLDALGERLDALEEQLTDQDEVLAEVLAIVEEIRDRPGRGR